eukprot:10635605-Alexandrium_andersonii.AAC.1
MSAGSLPTILIVNRAYSCAHGRRASLSAGVQWKHVLSARLSSAAATCLDACCQVISRPRHEA